MKKVFFTSLLLVISYNLLPAQSSQLLRIDKGCFQRSRGDACCGQKIIDPVTTFRPTSASSVLFQTSQAAAVLPLLPASANGQYLTAERDARYNAQAIKNTSLNYSQLVPDSRTVTMRLQRSKNCIIAYNQYHENILT